MDEQTFHLLMSRFDGLEDKIGDLRDEVAAELSGAGGVKARVRALEDDKTVRAGVMIGGGVVVTALSSLGGFLAAHWGRLFSGS